MGKKAKVEAVDSPPIATNDKWKSYGVVDNIRMIPIDLLKPNDYNPNYMDDSAFNRLVEEIQNVGFKVPVQTVPLEDGSFRIVDGEHRYHAGKFLNMAELPCFILFEDKFQDQDLQKFMTLRFNVLKGKINPEKFASLFTDLSKRYSEEALQSLMGFTNLDEWTNLTDNIADALESTGLSKPVIEKFKESAKGLKSVDDLTVLLNSIFSENGNDLSYNFISFGLGGKTVIYICCENEGCFYQIEKMTKTCRNMNVKADNLLSDLLHKWEKSDIFKGYLVKTAEVVIDGEEVKSE
jgi:Predicted transcriptional regulators